MAKHPISKVRFPSPDLQAFGLLWEGWSDSELQKRELANERNADIERLNQLCVERGISDEPDKLTLLALQLAREAYPKHKPKGRGTKWNEFASGALAVEVERLLAINTRHSVSKACDLLSKQQPWKSFLSTRNDPSSLGSDPAEALRREYNRVKKLPRTQLMRDAYGWHCHQNMLVQWTALVNDVLENPVLTIKNWE